MRKISRAAVLIAGDFRAWPRASEYIFSFVEAQAAQVDYYFATWTTTRDYWYPQSESIKTQRIVTDADVTVKFAESNRNLIGYKLLPQIPEMPGSNYYQSYLANAANILKRRHELEHKFVYDQVFEIRPDLYIVDVNPHSEPRFFREFECLVDVITDAQPDNKRHFPEAMDFYYQTSSFGSDVMCGRFYYRKSIHTSSYCDQTKHWPLPIHNHWVLTDYVYVRRLKTFMNYESVYQIAIRANFPADNLNNHSYDELFELQRLFLHYTRGNQNL